MSRILNYQTYHLLSLALYFFKKAQADVISLRSKTNSIKNESILKCLKQYLNKFYEIESNGIKIVA